MLGDHTRDKGNDSDVVDASHAHGEPLHPHDERERVGRRRAKHRAPDRRDVRETRSGRLRCAERAQRRHDDEQDDAAGCELALEPARVRHEHARDREEACVATHAQRRSKRDRGLRERSRDLLGPLDAAHHDGDRGHVALTREHVDERRHEEPEERERVLAHKDVVADTHDEKEIGRECEEESDGQIHGLSERLARDRARHDRERHGVQCAHGDPVHQPVEDPLEHDVHLPEHVIEVVGLPMHVRVVLRDHDPGADEHGEDDDAQVRARRTCGGST